MKERVPVSNKETAEDRLLNFVEEQTDKFTKYTSLAYSGSGPSYFVLNDRRDKLYQRIDLRVEEMLNAGLVEEVAALKKMGYDRSYVSMQGLGYKQLCMYLAGEITYDEAVYLIQRDTRHFAKRQLTWWRRESRVNWFDLTEVKEPAEIIPEILKLC